jgi:hypothetical protein
MHITLRQSRLPEERPARNSLADVARLFGDCFAAFCGVEADASAGDWDYIVTNFYRILIERETDRRSCDSYCADGEYRVSHGLPHQQQLNFSFSVLC